MLPHGTFLDFGTRTLVPLLLDINVPEKLAMIDRRKRTRAQVHWALCFSEPGTPDVLRTMTQNLSSQGLYCLAKAPFVPGETRECTLLVPTHDPNGGKPLLPVLCKIRVVRVEVLGEGGWYGIGCEIEDYRFVNRELPHDGFEWMRITANISNHEPNGSM